MHDLGSRRKRIDDLGMIPQRDFLARDSSSVYLLSFFFSLSLLSTVPFAKKVGENSFAPVPCILCLFWLSVLAALRSILLSLCSALSTGSVLETDSRSPTAALHSLSVPSLLIFLVPAVLILR